MSYVDGFVIPIPRKNLAAYRRMAQKAGRIWMEFGALQYLECVGDDLNPAMAGSFPKTLKLKRGETVVFSWILYRSKAQRDRINKRVMEDPRIERMMTSKPPFDFKRMLYAGFLPMVEL